ncbi:hypothetical protein IW262DRAFT_1460760 [Armillaria fumosa]|nr:hypothetical protein IW262DRAFT_1460760 [Armillaria fumosa]
MFILYRLRHSPRLPVSQRSSFRRHDSRELLRVPFIWSLLSSRRTVVAAMYGSVIFFLGIQRPGEKRQYGFTLNSNCAHNYSASMVFVGMLSFSRAKLYLLVTSTQQAMRMGVQSQAPSTCDMSASSTSSPSTAWTRIIATGSAISSSTISTTSTWSSTFSNDIRGALDKSSTFITTSTSSLLPSMTTTSVASIISQSDTTTSSPSITTTSNESSTTSLSTIITSISSQLATYTTNMPTSLTTSDSGSSDVDLRAF